MPITGRQFDLGITPEIEEWMRRIYEFLSTHPGEAYSLDELEQALLNVEPDHLSTTDFLKQAAEERRFQNALEKLVDNNVLRGAEVDGVAYFAPGRFSVADILKD